MIMLRTIGAMFAGNRQIYSYFVPEGDEPAVGDIIVTSVSYMPDVVTVSWGGNNAAEAKIATVVEVHEPGTPAPKANKFYAALVSAAEVRRRGEANAKLFQRVALDRAARKELKAMLDAEDERLRFKRLAETNPRARELLEQLGELPPPVASPMGKTAKARLTPEQAKAIVEADLDEEPNPTAYNGGTGIDPQQVNPSPRPAGSSPFAKRSSAWDD